MIPVFEGSDLHPHCCTLFSYSELCSFQILNIKFFVFRLEKFGGICDCQSTRDTFLYAASVDSRGLDAAIEIIADVVLRPEISEQEIELARYAIK